MFYVIQPDTLRPRYFTEARVRHATPVGQIPALHRELREQHPYWVGGFPITMLHGESAHVEVESKAIPADYFTAGIHRIVSANLKAVVESFRPGKVQFSPISVRQRGEAVSRDYFELCVLDEVAALDEERSEVTRHDHGALCRIHKLVLNDESVRERVLFRLENDGLTFARQDLAQAILDAGLTGAVFVPTNAYTDNWDSLPDVKQRLLQRSTSKQPK